MPCIRCTERGHLHRDRSPVHIITPADNAASNDSSLRSLLLMSSSDQICSLCLYVHHTTRNIRLSIQATFFTPMLWKCTIALA